MELFKEGAEDAAVICRALPRRSLQCALIFKCLKLRQLLGEGVLARETRVAGTGVRRPLQEMGIYGGERRPQLLGWHHLRRNGSHAWRCAVSSLVNVINKHFIHTDM